MPHNINRRAGSYRDCMTPAQSILRCRPGWRSTDPQDEARTRAEELLDASGELITLFTRKIKGDDVVDRVLEEPFNNYVSALPLHFMYIFEPTIPQGSDPTFDARFTANLSPWLSYFNNGQMHRIIDVNRKAARRTDEFTPIVIANRPATNDTNYFYVGNRSPFYNLSIKLFTRLDSDGVIWEYSLGNNVWLPIPLTSESTPSASTLQESGRMVFDTSISLDWREDFANGQKAYWVRANIPDSIEGQASAVNVFTENVIQGVVLWNEGDDPHLFPNEKCVTIKVNNTVYNRVYDVRELDYSEESFVLMRRNDFTQKCGLNFDINPECGLKPFDVCETDPILNIDKLGNCDLRETIRIRELAFLYNQLTRAKQFGNSDAMILLFTRNLLLNGTTITATYENQCPCVAYYRGQGIPDKQQSDSSACNVCLGTELVNGFERFVNPEREDGKILMSFPSAPFDKPLERHGLGTEHVLTTAWTSYTPRVYVRDLIIRYDEFGRETLRYIINKRTDSIHRRGILVHQQVELVALDPDKFEYKIQAPSLPLAPSQEEILQSLGVLVPAQPDDPDGCIKRRLEKGIKLCDPKRNRLQE